ncbi:MAG: hypothetical protein ACO3A2_03330 [Bdellovibrionia bacterium]
MTPHIVRQYEKVRGILDRKLKERDDFLEAGTGGTDPQRMKRDEIIRSLPDLDKLVNEHPPTTITIDEDTPQASSKTQSGPAPAAVLVPDKAASPAGANTAPVAQPPETAPLPQASIVPLTEPGSGKESSAPEAGAQP